MILQMARVRVFGPRARLPEALTTLQDLGVMQLIEPLPQGPVECVGFSPTHAARRRRIERIMHDLEVCLAALGPAPRPADTARAGRGELARWARLARRLRPQIEQLGEQAAQLSEEQALILKYRPFFTAFGRLLSSESTWEHAATYHVVLRADEATVVPRLAEALREAVGEEFELKSQRLPTGEIALLIFITGTVAKRVEQILLEARLHEIPVPASYGARTLAQAVPRMLERLAALPAEMAAVEQALAELVAENGAELVRARRAFRNLLAELDAVPLAGATGHAFIVEGWVPVEDLGSLRDWLEAEFGGLVVLEELCRRGPGTEQAPVVLRNPRPLRPFEMVLALLAPPRYGSIDPTPFVAVFFPLFFGMMVGDIGYGLVMVSLVLFLRSRTQPGTPFRSVSEIAGVCAASSIVFGVLFGELFGSLGRHWFGLEPLAFDREEALVTFLGVAVALGFVHVLVGLILGALSAWRHSRRHALARATAALIVILCGTVVLSGVGLLPGGVLYPGLVALGLCLPVLIFAEGFMGPIEILSTLGNVLSYARIMALGTAGVMLAAVANEMAAALSPLALGILVGFLFHALNFGLSLFSPTIHSLRLHYVEFFGKFYDPGGAPYRPFCHWDQQPGRRA